MEINNKYQIGQKVFFLADGKAKCDEVRCVNIFVYEKSVNISYSFEKVSASKYEDEVFPTEAELKAFVFDDLIDFV